MGILHLKLNLPATLLNEVKDAHRVRESLTTKMVQMQVGNEVRLRIIDRLPELS